MSDAIRYSLEDGVATITMDVPERRNAFSREMRLTIEDHIAASFAAGDCRAIILTGAGGHFSSGADLTSVDPGEMPWPALKTRENFREVHRLVNLISTGPKIVIAAVEGLAYGGGFSLALCCDHVVAARNARFGGAFGRLGLIGDMGLLWSLKERVGTPRAKRILLLGREIDGEAAFAQGIADDLTEPGEALTTAHAVAMGYAAVAPLSVAYTKAAYTRGIDRLGDAFAAEMDYVPILNRSNDFAAAIAAFKEKRTPVFTGS